MSYKDDQLKYEKGDPVEGDSRKLIFIPVILFSIMVGFGMAYIYLKTEDFTYGNGDSRTYNFNKKTESKEASEMAAPKELTFEEVMNKGKMVYKKTCQACHQDSGLGIPGAFPTLSQSKWVTGPEKRLIAIIDHGVEGKIEVNGTVYNSAMPGFGKQLSHDEIAYVATYIRNSFSNEASEVKAETVIKVKESLKDKTSSWDGEKELNSKNWD